MALADVQPVADFSDYIAERTTGFTGRAWVFDKLAAWLDEPDGPRVFLLTGQPGGGKTALAARLVQMTLGEVPADDYPRLGPGGLAFYHFCQAQRDATLNPLRFIEALARQLANRHPPFARAMIATNDRNITITATQSIGTAANGATVQNVVIQSLQIGNIRARTAFDRLVRAPLEALYATGFDEQIVILVDSLDEAWTFDPDENIARLLGDAADAADDLPAQVRLLLTSRPDKRIPRVAGQATLDLFDDAPVGVDDVEGYVKPRLTPLAPLRFADLVAKLVIASHGNFLYARYVIDDLLAHPEDVANIEDLQLPNGLKGQYGEFMRREIARSGNRMDERYRSLLGALAVALGEGLTAIELAGITKLRRSETDDMLHVLEQYLTPPSLHGRRGLYHQSFRDFLLNDQVYNIYPDEAHEAIARFFLDEYGANWLSDEPHGDARDYALQHTPTHLLEAMRLSTSHNVRRRLRQRCEGLLSNFEFLEAKTARFGLDELLRDFKVAMRTLLETNSLAPWLRILDREAHTLRGWHPDSNPAWFAQQVRNCAYRLGATSVLAAAEDRLKQLNVAFLGIRWQSSLESESLVRVLSGHAGPIHRVVITPDGTRIVSGGDQTVRIWDLETGAELRTLIGHTDLIWELAVTPDGERVISASFDGDVRIWDIDSGQPVRTFTSHTDSITAVVITPDGKQVISAGGTSAILWELATGIQTHVFEHPSLVFAVAVTPDGQHILTGSGDQTVQIWDTRTGHRLATLTGHTGSVISIAVAPDGHRVVAGGIGGTVLIWDLGTGQILHRLTDLIGLENVMVTADGRRVVADSYDSLRVWDIDSGQEIHRLGGHTDIILASLFTPDGKRALSGSRDRTVRVWDLNSGTKVCTLAGHTDEVSCLAATPHKSYAVSGASDATVRVWDIEQCTKSIERDGTTGAVRALAITNDGRTCVSGSDDHNVAAWDIRTGQQLHTYIGHTGPVRAVVVTPDGQRVVSGSKDNTIRVWEMSSGTELITLSGHTGWVDELSTVPDSSWIVSGGWDGTARLWDISSGRQLQSFGDHTNYVSVLEVTRDGQHLVTGSDNVLHIWDLATGRELYRLQHPDLVWAVAFTPDGHYVVSACHDGILRTWELGKGQEVQRFEGHHSPVRTLAITPDGKRFLTGADDTTVRVWDAASGREVHVLRGHASNPWSLAVTPDSEFAVSGSADQTVHVWDLGLGRQVAAAQLDGWVNQVAAPTNSEYIAAGYAGVFCLVLRR